MEHGFPMKDWNRALRQAAGIIAHGLSRRIPRPVTYSDIASGVTAVHFVDPHDQRIGVLLGNVSEREHEKGRGLLSAAVVHKTGDMLPGAGFFNLARELGRLHGTSPTVEERFWIAEFNRLIAENNGGGPKKLRKGARGSGGPSVVQVRG
jgi:hypothetical protein